jgi:hypothetical protein
VNSRKSVSLFFCLFQGKVKRRFLVETSRVSHFVSIEIVFFLRLDTDPK